MRYRKLVAGVALVAGLGGSGLVAAAPSLVVGSTATAGVPMICWDGEKTCGTVPGRPILVDPSKPTTTVPTSETVPEELFPVDTITVDTDS